MAEWDKEVAVAAKYWADFLRAKERPSRLNNDQSAWEKNADLLDIAGVLGANADAYIDALKYRGAKVPNFTAEQVDLFERKLRRILHLAFMFKRASDRERVYLHDDSYALVVTTDYHPDDYLTLAGHLSGFVTIKDDRLIDNLEPYLPWKTAVWIKLGSVRACEGYNGDTFELMEAQP